VNCLLYCLYNYEIYLFDILDIFDLFDLFDLFDIGIGSGGGGLVSRPMQRKLVTLLGCQLVEPEGRARALRAARSLGERTVTELILQHQNPQQLSANLWAAVRARGCQFLGPGTFYAKDKLCNLNVILQWKQ